MNEKPTVGIDVGTRRIGLAVSAPGGHYALPHGTVEVRPGCDDAIHQIADWIVECSAHVVVLGWPLEMDGTEGRSTRRVEHFERALKASLEMRGHQVSIHHWDERLTSKQAEDFLIGTMNMSRRRRKGAVDRLAATHILEGFLRAQASLMR